MRALKAGFGDAAAAPVADDNADVPAVDVVDDAREILSGTEGPDSGCADEVDVDGDGDGDGEPEGSCAGSTEGESTTVGVDNGSGAGDGEDSSAIVGIVAADATCVDEVDSE